MGIKFNKPTTTNNQKELVPQGNHLAIIYKIVEIGTKDYDWQGEAKTKRAVRVWYELPNQTRVFNEEKGEQPMSVSKEYNLTPHEKATIMIHFSAMDNKIFTEDEMYDLDIVDYLGKSCMLQIVHKTSEAGRTFAVITSVSSVPDGMNVAEQYNDNSVFDYDSNFKIDVLESQPEWLKEQIKASPEYAKAIENITNNDEDFQVKDPVENLPF